MRQLYRTNQRLDSKKLAKYLAQDGQLLLPLLDLILNTESAIDEVIDVTGRAAIEAILLLSASRIPVNSKGRSIAMAHKMASYHFRTESCG